MLTKESIKTALNKDQNWTPADDAPESDWDLFEEVYEQTFGEEETLQKEDPWDDLEEDDDDELTIKAGKLDEEEEW